MRKVNLNNPRQRAIAEVILQHRLGESYDAKAVRKLLPEVNRATITQIKNELQRLKWVIPPLVVETKEEIEGSEQQVIVLPPKTVPPKVEAKTDKVEAIPEGGDRNLAAIGARKPSPVLFKIGDVNIAIDPNDLYESYFIYSKLKQEQQISNSFSELLRIGMKTIYVLTNSDKIPVEV